MPKTARPPRPAIATAPVTEPTSQGAALAIEARGVTKNYRTKRGAPDVQALRGVDLDVPAGIVYALLGPNGAGKSTLTKILTTLSMPTGGTAVVAGHDVRTRPADVRAAIGYVSQGTAADPLLTALENLSMAARLRGMAPADAVRRSRDLLAEFDLDPDSKTVAGKLSGGMRRKLDVAIGLIHAPQILFLDEPTTGLDPEARAAMWNLVRQLTTSWDMTVVLTTHYLDEADALADRVGIIDRGAMVIEGTPADLKATLNGDSITVELVTPDAELVRAVAGEVPGLRDIVVEARGTEGLLIARCDDSGASVGRVIAVLEGAGIAFGSVAAARPSLDDVYLHYAGRSYAAAQAGAAHADSGAGAAPAS